MDELNVSREFLFRECNLRRHCIALHLTKPIKIGQREVDVVYLTSLIVDEQQWKELFVNMMKVQNTFGEFVGNVFMENESPYETQPITMSTNQILYFEKVNT